MCADNFNVNSIFVSKILFIFIYLDLYQNGTNLAFIYKTIYAKMLKQTEKKHIKEQQTNTQTKKFIFYLSVRDEMTNKNPFVIKQFIR